MQACAYNDLQTTQNIKNEVDSQHVLLDGMGDSMGNTRGFLTAVNDKFKVVRVCVVHLCTAKVSQLHPASFLHALRS